MEGQLLSAFLGGVAGVGVSLGALCLSATCGGGPIVPKDSALHLVLRAISMPGATVARGLDRAGGCWLSLGAYFVVSFVIWAALAWAVKLVMARAIGPRPHA